MVSCCFSSRTWVQKGFTVDPAWTRVGIFTKRNNPKGINLPPLSPSLWCGGGKKKSGEWPAGDHRAVTPYLPEELLDTHATGYSFHHTFESYKIFFSNKVDFSKLDINHWIRLGYFFFFTLGAGSCTICRSELAVRGNEPVFILWGTSAGLPLVALTRRERSGCLRGPHWFLLYK